MKLNYKCILLSFLIFTVFSLTAQNRNKNETIVISGMVYDSQKMPVSGVHIIADEGKVQGSTGTTGSYQLKIRANSKLLFEHPEYEDLYLTYLQIKQLNFNVVMIRKSSNDMFDKVVNLPYVKKAANTIAGNISVVDVQKEYNRDSRTDLASVINGKISGSRGVLNINGLGAAYTVVDGIPMGVGYTNVRDVEEIVILKDAMSRLLYSVESDIPVILITTKKGKQNKKDIRFSVESGLQQAIAYPRFLDGASYMETYNKAYRNDGATTDFYLPDLIQKTRSGIDPVLYPDNDYYSSDYVKNVSNYTNVYGTVSGGDEKTQYLLSLDWVNNPGWIKLNNTVNNVFNIRGRIDYEVNKWMKMHSQVLASYNLVDGPNMNDFWSQANTYLPNAIPELIPLDRINNLDSLSNYHTIDGKYLLGGNSIYQNSMHGDLLRSGNSSQMKRYVQSSIGFDMDLSAITRGLAAHGYVGYDFYNVYKQIISDTYSVYEIGAVDEDNRFPVTQIGVDKTTSLLSVSNTDMSFSRSAKWNYTLNYDRVFGNHALTAVGLGYGSFYTENDISQNPRKIGFGGQASYMYSNKYIIDAGIMSQSSVKIKPQVSFGLSKSMGLAWVASNEKFIQRVNLINYLKMRASFGQFVSDAFTAGSYNGYFLNENIYARTYNYAYNNGQISNYQVRILGVYNDIDWQKRNEFSAGFDMAMLNNKLCLDATYTNSYSFDNITSMDVIKPLVAGSITTYDNYNSTDYQAFNIGLKYKENFAGLKLELGLYYTWCNAVIKKYAENTYTDPTQKHLTRVGTDARGIWGLKSERLYLASDFDSNGKLAEGIPVPAWGDVKPGDIKYEDYNHDGVVNENDVSVIGRNSNNSQLSLNIDLKYKQWQLFLLPIAQFGGKGLKNSNYYWFKGNSAKYSEIALGAFDENDPDPNADYPRLSLGSGSNNYRNSTFWLYDRSNLQLITAQLSYNMSVKNPLILNNIMLYGKGTNLFMLAKDKDVLQLNYGGAPQSRVFSIGAMLTF